MKNKEHPILTIKCAHCKSKIFKYNKIGKGRVLRCYKDRIAKDYSIHENGKIKCKCGNIVGIEDSQFIKMKQGAFTYSGTKVYKNYS